MRSAAICWASAASCLSALLISVSAALAWSPSLAIRVFSWSIWPVRSSRCWASAAAAAAAASASALAAFSAASAVATSWRTLTSSVEPMSSRWDSMALRCSMVWKLSAARMYSTKLSRCM